MSYSHINFREKIKDEDPDIRQMALYDLHTELQKEGFTLEDQVQRDIVDAMLQMLEDNSTEVQGNAVKCLAPLVKKIKETYAEKLFLSLCTSCLQGKKEKRDIATTALKTMVAETPATFSTAIKKLMTPLVAGVAKVDNEAKLEVLDVINDVVKRFGTLVFEEHEHLQQTLLEALNSPRAPIRKKAIVCLASLCVFTTDALFALVVKMMVEGIERSKGENLRKYIQCCSAVSRTAGHRLGRSLDRIIPLLMTQLEAQHSASFTDEEKDEVRENIIQALESFVLRCPSQVGKFFPTLVAACKQFITWDPNYTYGDDNRDGDAMDEDVDEDAVEGEELDQEEDDDVSWKVRKAATKCLLAIITTRPDQLELLYGELCCAKNTLLPDRFKEREENVKLDILSLFEKLLQETKIITNVGRYDLVESSFLDVSMTGSFRVKIEARPQVKYLVEVKELVVRGLLRALREKSPKIKALVFTILKELCLLLGSNMEPFIGDFVAITREGLTEKVVGSNSALKTEVLTFLRVLLVTAHFYSASVSVFGAHIGVLCPLVIACINDRYYKITAEALRVCGELVKVISKLPKEADPGGWTKQLFACVFGRLSTQDIDQDVKESAIVTVGKILSTCTKYLSPDDLKKSQTLLLQLLRNEMSRLSTIKTISVIKEVSIDPPILAQYLAELSSFLRKSSKQLRQASLVTLCDLFKNCSHIEDAICSQILEELSPLLSDQDLNLSCLALELCNQILVKHPSSAKQLEAMVLPKVNLLLTSPLLQGHALEAVRNLFRSLSFESTVSCEGLLARVTEAATSKQALGNVAQVIAVLLQNVPLEGRTAVIQTYCGQLRSSSEMEVLLALCCLGEIGREVGLGGDTSLLDSIRQHFESPSEEVKAAAAMALGRVCAGNLKLYLPRILEEVRTSKTQRYLLLRCLKKLIGVASSSAAATAVTVKPELLASLPSLLPVLMQHSECEEEGVRNVVAECLGKLALTDPEKVLPELKAKTAPGCNQLTKATVITALKYTITESPQPIDKFLTTSLREFLPPALQKSEAPKIRRAAILLFTAAAHNKPALIRSDLSLYIPALYAETPVDKSLVREVNLGPFKHRVDDGLEIRKAAFECMDILLDNRTSSSLLEFLNDYSTFIAHVKLGLMEENQDIKMLAHLMISKLTKFPNAVVPLLAALDELTEVLQSTATTKLKGTNPVQQEKERHDDLIKSCLRAVYSLSLIKGALDHTKFSDLVNKVILMDKELNLRALFESIQKESDKAEAAADGDPRGGH